MLPEYIDQSDRYRFTANTSRGFHVGFFEFAPNDIERPVAQHWLRECGDERSLKAMIRWLVVRRADWQKWGRLAEALGPDAFDSHINQLMEAEPIVEAVSVSVTKRADPREIALGDVVAARDGVRIEVLCVHRFSSANARDGFFNWFLTDRNGDQTETLLNIAKVRGTVALGEVLDELAECPTPKRRKARQ